MKYDAVGLLKNLLKELTNSIDSLEAQIELNQKESPGVVPLLEGVQKKHIDAREATVKALKQLE